MISVSAIYRGGTGGALPLLRVGGSGGIRRWMNTGSSSTHHDRPHQILSTILIDHPKKVVRLVSYVLKARTNVRSFTGQK